MARAILRRCVRRSSSLGYSGLSYAENARIRSENVFPSLAALYSKPLLLSDGFMQHVYDHEGREYLDLFGGVCTVSVGHRHPHLVKALQAQADRLWHTTHLYWHSPMHEYATALTNKLPGDLKVCYFVNSGSEANDLALSLARLHTKRQEIVSLRNCYHGITNALMGVIGMGTWKHPVVATNGQQSMNADPYRGLWGGENCRDSPCQPDRTCACSGGVCEAADRYAEQLADMLRHSVAQDNIAAFFAEGIQGGGGIVQFPRGFLKQAVSQIRAQGGLYIADEVQTGFGRTGETFWGFEMHHVVPDIVTMAKSIGNGFPLAAVVTTKEIAASLQQAVHFNTFGGNPLACAVGKATLEVIENDNLQKNSANVGTYLLQRLDELRRGSAIVGDVRGKGLMVGVELVRDKTTREPLSNDAMSRIHEMTRDRGILIGRGGLHKNVFRIQPPMCITKDDADRAVEVIEEALEG